MNTTPADIERALWDLIDLCAANPAETKQTSPRLWRHLAIYATLTAATRRFGATDIARLARLPKHDTSLPPQLGLAPLLGHLVLITHVEHDLHETRYHVSLVPDGPEFWATDDMLDRAR